MTTTLPGSGPAAPTTPPVWGTTPVQPDQGTSIGAIVLVVVASLCALIPGLIVGIVQLATRKRRYRVAGFIGTIGAGFVIALIAILVAFGSLLGHSSSSSAPRGYTYTTGANRASVPSGALGPKQSPPVAVTTIKPGPTITFAPGAQGDIQSLETLHSKALGQGDPNFLKRYYANTEMAGYTRDMKIEGSTIQQDPDPWTLVKVKVLSATNSQIVADVTFQLAHGTITYTNTYTNGAGPWRLVAQTQ